MKRETLDCGYKGLRVIVRGGVAGMKEELDRVLLFNVNFVFLLIIVVGNRPD